MRRLLFFVVIPVVAFVALAWVWSFFIDWSKPAELFASRFQEATGYTVVMEGAAGGHLLPTPAMMLENVRLKPAEGSHQPEIRVPLLKIGVSLASVLSGSPSPTHISLLSPEWQRSGTLTQGLERVFLTPLPLDIIHGRITAEEKDGVAYEKLQLSIAVAGAGSPINMQGSVEIAGQSVQWELGLNHLPDQQPAEYLLMIKDAASEWRSKGVVTQSGNVLQAKGDFQLQSSAIAGSLPFVMPFWKTHGLETLPLHALQAEGTLEWNGTSLSLTKLVARMGTETVRGELNITPRTAEFHAALEAEGVTLDPYLESAEKIIDALKKEKKRTSDQTEQRLGMQNTDIMPATAKGDLQFSGKGLVWRGQSVPEAVVEASFDAGVWTLPRISASLPGAVQMQASGSIRDYQQRWMFAGKTDMKGEDLRVLLTWGGVQLPTMPDDVLKAFALTSSVTVTPDIRRLTEMRLQVDGGTISGAMIYKRPAADAKEGTLPTLEASVAMEGVNIDRMMPPESFLPAAEAASGQMAERMQWLSGLPFEIKGAFVARDAQFRSLRWEQMQARLQASQGLMEVSAFAAQTGALQAGGSFRLEPGQVRPKLALTLTTNAIKSSDIVHFIAGRPVAVATTQAAEASQWSDAPMDLSLLGLWDGSIDASFGQLELAEASLQNLRVQGALQDSQLTVNQAAGTLSQGDFKLRGRLAGGNLPTLESVFLISNVEFEKLLGVLLPVRAFQGKASLSGSVKSSGVSQRAMVENMVGSGTLSVRELTIDGFDLNAISRKVLAARTVDDVSAIAKAALTSGTTKINQMEARFALDKALLQLPVTQLQTDYTDGGVQASVDLLQLLMNVRLSFKPRTATDASVPSVHLLLQGKASEPTRKLDTADLEAYIAKRAVRSGL
jgi:hypothetical protein